MAKKRGAVSPLGNTAGSEEAQKNAAKANIDSLAHQLSNELTKVGSDVAEYLAEHFGLSAVGNQYEWQLASGKTAVFSELTLTYDQVKNNTVVTFDVNGREQSMLTPESLSDLDSLALQQFYPAVGHEVDGKIDVLDGSRRRAWFLFQGGKVNSFRILVTKDELSLADAKALAKQLQTAKEHNLREIGLQCLALKNADESLTQADIAMALNISQSAVSKSMKAASVHPAIINLFPVVNDLAYSDYVVLSSVNDFFDSENQLIEFIEKIKDLLCHIPEEYSVSEQKEPILSVIRSELKSLQEAPEKEKAVVTQLAEFKTAGVFARKRVKGRNFSYEFGRMPKELQKKLDKTIGDILDEYKGE